MSLFNKKNKKNDFDQETARAEKEVIASIIDTKMTVTGELSFSGKARIDGTVKGNIKGEHLILSESGRVIGDISASSLVCHGTIEGNSTVNLFNARKSSCIHGRIEAASLTVEPGAELNGDIKVATRDLHLVEKDDGSVQESAAG